MASGASSGVGRRREHPRVFLGLAEVAGYYSALAEGLRQLGVDVVQLDISGDPHQQVRGETPNRMAGILSALGRRRQRAQRRPVRLFWWLCVQLWLVPMFFWAMRRCDAFIFGYRTTFFHLLDLPLVRLLGKRVICVFHGSDARPPYLNGAFLTDGAPATLRRCRWMTARTQWAVRWIERWADVVVNHPPTAQFHTRPFIRWLSIGIPLPPAPAVASTPHRAEPVRIVHAPTRPEQKGSAVIRAAIEALRGEGFIIDFVELTGRPHAEVLAELARCDFVVDELYSDTPLAGFATEAAAHGKAAVVGGYGWVEVLADLPEEDVPPSLLCHPGEVVEAIRRMLTEPGLREELGRAAATFVHARWNPLTVAERYLELIRHGPAADWLCEPGAVRYLHGWGLTEAQLRERVGAYVRMFGPAALHLADKSELEGRLAAFAEDGPEVDAAPVPA